MADARFNDMMKKLREESAKRKAKREGGSEEKKEEPKKEEKVEKPEEKVEEKKEEKKEEKVAESSEKASETKEEKAESKPEPEAKEDDGAKTDGKPDIPDNPRVASLKTSDPKVILGHALTDVMAEAVAKALFLVSLKDVKLKVRKTYSEKGEILCEEDGDSEIIETPAFTGPTATVSANYGATINLGDYNSAKVDVFVSAPCYITEIDNALTFVKKKAQETLMKNVDEIKEARA